MALHVQADEWTKDQVISNEWTTVWSADVIGTKAKFFDAIWQLNSGYVRVRLTYNDFVAVDIDLEELTQDYKIGFGGVQLSCFILNEYENQRWILKPPEPFYVNVGSSVKIEMKSTKANKNYVVSRGISVWGQP